MRRSRRAARRTHALGALLSCVILLVAAAALIVLSASVPPVSADDPLEPYRTLSYSPGATELLALARGAMDHYYGGGAGPAEAHVELDWPAAPVGVYVSLFRGSTTRACVGSATPVGGTLAATVRTLAVQALTADPRRPPVRREELAQLRVAIAFAGPGEPVADPMIVQPLHEGLLIRSSAGSVAYLPGEARTVSWALREARRSGLLTGRAQDAHYERFPVVVLKEPEHPVAKDSRDSHDTE